MTEFRSFFHPLNPRYSLTFTDQFGIQKERSTNFNLFFYIFNPLTVSILAPFNFVQNRYQLMTQMKRNGLIQNLYKSYSDCIQTAIMQKHGIETLWNGKIVKIFVSGSSLTFSLANGYYWNKQIINIVKSYSSQNDSTLNYFGIIAGMVCTLVSLVIFYPFEYAYTRLVCDKESTVRKKNQFRGISHAIFLTGAQQ